MIVSFGDSETEFVWEGTFSKKIKLPKNLHDLARRKLRMIYAAPTIDTLLVPPGNHLEQLKGDRKGKWSIRISDQWRITFEWVNGNAHNVIIEDYH
jgi:proteic killer suppression protein